jgi:hypothetical protein
LGGGEEGRGLVVARALGVWVVGESLASKEKRSVRKVWTCGVDVRVMKG